MNYLTVKQSLLVDRKCKEKFKDIGMHFDYKLPASKL